MKVAIVHDYIKEYGGAERVLEALHEVYPKAPIFTLVYLPRFLGPHKDRFKQMDIRTSFLQYFPLKSKLISFFRVLAPMIFKRFDFKGFDIIIVSQTGSYFPNSINKKKAKLICYSHTPPRYLYGFETARDWKKNKLFKVFGQVAIHFLRMTDFKSSRNVDYFIANSKNIAGRIKKFYRRESKVIYPPVDVKNHESRITNQESKDYYLVGGRLARPKHIDLIVKTFTKSGLLLKIFGKPFAGYGEELKEIAGSNVQFLGEISDSDKLELMRNAKAFIFASEDEDFGITPVEAMGAGTPVVAYRSGGVLESVVEGKTGIFFDHLLVEDLLKAINKLSKLSIKRENCINQAKKFSKERFKKEIEKFVASKA